MGCAYFQILWSSSIEVNALIVANKPRGLQAARKLRNTRRDNRWVRSQSTKPHIAHTLTLFFGGLGGQILQKARAR